MRRTGALLNFKIDFEEREKQIEEIFKSLKYKEYEFYYRSRALFSIENPIPL